MRTLASAEVDSSQPFFGRATAPDRSFFARFAAPLGLAAILLAVSLGARALVPFENVSAISAGEQHTCAVTTGGGAKCWGGGNSYQIGDGVNTDRPLPVNVSGLTSGVTGIATGRRHTCAITTGGGVKCWGDNSSGQLGDNSTTYGVTPVDVSGLASGVAAIAPGSSHTCALTSGGGVKCWGRNNTGQLGDNSTTNRLTPVDVVGFASGVAAIAAGESHTCALTTGGGIKCWGLNTNGQLGDNSITQRLTPVDVTGLTTGQTAIALGALHSCAISTGGAIKCWGQNTFGQLGDNSVTQRLTPVDVAGLASGVLAASAGQGHTCSIVTGGGVKCWGINGAGALGDGTTTQRLTPTDVSGLSSGVAAIASGQSHTCALMAGGGVQCWGNNFAGQLGDNVPPRRLVPTQTSGLTSGITSIETGGEHACARDSGGGVKCWGRNSERQLADGTTEHRLTPVDAVALATTTTAIAVGVNDTCALTAGGGVKCWGSNDYGALGDNSGLQQPAPVDVFGLTSGVSAVKAGGQFACALTTGGGAKCWGRNLNGQLGDNSTTSRMAPVDVSGLTSGVAAIATGSHHTCALTTGGGVKCWGLNGNGQLGDNTTTQRLTAVDVSGLLSGVSAIATGGSHSCALTTGGGVKCWGWNVSGQLGDNSSTTRLTPVDVSGLTSGVAAIAAGQLHTCALTTGGGIKCWGGNSYGELGDGSQSTRFAPFNVTGLTSGVAAIAAGGGSTCALTTGGSVKCWGNNFYGQVGDGTAAFRTVPSPVLTLATTTTSITSSGTPTNDGSPVTFTATVVPATATGTVNFRDGPSGIATVPLVAGTAQYTTSGLDTGSHSITAVYAGDANHTGSTSVPITHVVDIVYYTLSITIAGPGSGTVSSSPAGISCPGDCAESLAKDTYVTLTATPNAGSMVSGWTGDAFCGAFSTMCYVAMNSAKSVTAQFVPNFAPMSGIAQISVGADYTCALTTGGGVKCWGSNSYGQLGDGTTTSRPVPAIAAGLASGTSQVSAGNVMTCAVTAAGGVRCWGSFFGDPTPVNIPELASGVSAVNVGDLFACALTNGGGVKCWPDGQPPADVADLTSGVAAIVNGEAHTCVLTTSGGVKCWGWNGYGQVGNNSFATQNTPVDVTGLAGGISAVAAGYAHNCAVTTGGGVKCWGKNDYGELGDNTTTVRETPVDVQGLGASVVAVTAGWDHTCALTAGGGVKCWGGGGQGQLGDNSFVSKPYPVDVLGLSSGVVGISSGPLSFHTCALLANGTMKCWGNGGHALGNPTVNFSTVPVDVLSDVASATSLASSGSPSTQGTAVTFTATVTGGSGAATSGTVNFKDGPASIPGCGAVPVASGSAQCSTAALTIASHAITAVFSGNVTYEPSTSAVLIQVVNAPASHMLTVSLAGTGTGSVASTPAGIACAADCTEDFSPSTVVTLRATAGANSGFSGWSGSGCSGNGNCVVTMSSARSVTANFDPTPSSPRRADANGDGRSDVIWRNATTGQLYEWQMNGLAISAQAYLPTRADLNWKVMGIGDIDGDGKADIVWRNSATAANEAWLLNGFTTTTLPLPAMADTNWEIVGVGDFNGDGRSDIFWRHKVTGGNYLWIMGVAGAVASQGSLLAVADVNWEVVGVADFDANARADVLWRNKVTGANYVWLMNGLTITAQAYLPSVADVNWEVVAVADASGDGRGDVFWRNKVSGLNYLWLVNGLLVSGQAYLPSVADVNWKVAAFGDYDGDGKADILWRNASTGADYLWLMNGLAIGAQAYVPTVADANWQPVKR